MFKDKLAANGEHSVLDFRVPQTQRRLDILLPPAVGQLKLVSSCTRDSVVSSDLTGEF